MSKHEHKHCPRCNTVFECKAGSITQCQCFGIRFSESEKQALENAYTGCLCRSCLIEMKNGFGLSTKPLPLPENLPDA